MLDFSVEILDDSLFNISFLVFIQEKETIKI